MLDNHYYFLSDTRLSYTYTHMHTKNTPLYKICDRIQNGLLKKKDPHLHEHLVQMGIEPQIYGL